jgi:hypothetical protein
MHDPMLVNDLEREAPRPTHLPQPDTRCDRLRGGDCLRQRRFLARVPLPLHREQLMDDGHDVLPAAPPPYLPPCSWHWMECATRSGGCLEEIGQYVTLGNIRRLRKMICYLVAWLLLSHGFTTLTLTALHFAKTTLHIPPSSLVPVCVLTPNAGILGALL